VDISLSRTHDPAGPREAFYCELKSFRPEHEVLRHATARHRRINHPRSVSGVFPAPVAARGAKVIEGRSLAPRERARSAGSDERSRPQPAESLDGCAERRRSRASASDVLVVYFRTDSLFRELFNDLATR
jgi:hypothetical protein